MMCWKRASADMQSLGKHVEGMIHFETTEAPKTQAFPSYLYVVNETGMKKQGR